MDEIQVEQIISEFRKVAKNDDDTLASLRNMLAAITSKTERLDERTANIQKEVLILTKIRDEILPTITEFKEYKRLHELLPVRIENIEKEIDKRIDLSETITSKKLSDLEKNYSNVSSNLNYHCKTVADLDYDRRLRTLEKTYQRTQGGITAIIILQILIGVLLAAGKLVG